MRRIFYFVFVMFLGCQPKTGSEIPTDSLSVELAVSSESPGFDGILDDGGSVYADSTANSEIVYKADSAVTVTVLSKSSLRMPLDTTEEPDPCDVYYWYQVSLPDGKQGWIHGSYYLELFSSDFQGGRFTVETTNYRLLLFTTTGVDVADDQGLTGCTVQFIPVLYVTEKKKINFIYMGSAGIRDPDISCDEYDGRLSLVSSEGGSATIESVDTSDGIRLILSVSFQEGGGTGTIRIGTEDGLFKVLDHSIE